nr:glycosyltransferase family 39 protein [Streptomyces sp. Xyl84]
MTSVSALPPSPPVAEPGAARKVLLRPVVTAAVLFAAVRAAGVAVAAGVAWTHGRHPLALLGRSWDSLWYLRIAAHGYGYVERPRPGVVHNDLAFFPLYPALIRAVHLLLPVSGGAAGLVVAWSAAAVAAGGIYAVGAHLHGRAAGTALAALWGLLPHSVVLSMGYSEPVLTACAAWALYAVLAGHWVRAGALAALAGLARPNGVAVAVAVLAAAAVAVGRARAQVSHRLWTGAALAPLGWTGYVLWAGHRTGDPLRGYLRLQRLWGSRFDFGLGALRFVKHLLVHREAFLFFGALTVVAAGLLLYALLVLDRAPLPLVAYSGVLLGLACGDAGFFQCKPRFLLPAFPLLLPLARALVRTARARPWHAAVVACALAGLSFAYGAYLLAVTHTPL